MESVVIMRNKIKKENIFGIISVVIIILLLFILNKVIDCADDKIKKKDSIIDRYSKYFYLCSSWLDARGKNIEIADYLNGNNIYTVGVYGMADIGYKLCKELSKNNKVEVKFVMDRNISIDTMFAPIIKIDDVLPEVDAIIVTPIHIFNSIEGELKERTGIPIISLEDIIYNL